EFRRVLFRSWRHEYRQHCKMYCIAGLRKYSTYESSHGAFSGATLVLISYGSSRAPPQTPYRLVFRTNQGIQASGQGLRKNPQVLQYLLSFSFRRNDSNPPEVMSSRKRTVRSTLLPGGKFPIQGILRSAPHRPSSASEIQAQPERIF